MSVDMNLVKKLREETGIGILECKKAIIEAGNDFEKAAELLRKKGFEKAKAKSSRTTKQGIVGSYIHTSGKIGVLVEVGCETDFVAKNEDFQALVKDVAMQIAAMNPIALSREDVSDEVKNEQRELFKKQMADSGKPPEILEKIIEGKLNKELAEMCLLDMTFVKDTKIKVKDLVAKTGKDKNADISIGHFKRMQIGG